MRRDGAYGLVRNHLKRAWSNLSFSEDHIWFALDPSAERPRPQLAPELTLKRPGKSDLQLLEQLTAIDVREAGARIDAGNDLWSVLEDDRLMFNCWIILMASARFGKLRRE